MENQMNILFCKHQKIEFIIEGSEGIKISEQGWRSLNRGINHFMGTLGNLIETSE